MRRHSTGFALLIGLIVLVAGGKAILYDTLDPDLFWHLRVADQIMIDGIAPLQDHLSFASIREPWTPYSWLAELGMKAVWDAGGFRLTVLLQAIFQAAFLTFVALASIERTRLRKAPVGRDGNPAASTRDTEDGGIAIPPYGNHASALHTHTLRDLPIILSLALAAYWSLAFLSFRPVTFVLTFIAMSWWLLQRDRRKNNQSFAVWMIVPIAILATNMHFFSVYIPLLTASMAISPAVNALRARHGRARLLPSRGPYIKHPSPGPVP